MLGGVLAVDDGLAALEGKVAVKLEHCGARRNQFGTVHLNLITALRIQQSEWSRGEDREQQNSRKNNLKYLFISPENDS